MLNFLLKMQIILRAIILSSKDDFLKLTDYNYPKFFVINKNGIISSYKASFFQERTIDKLSNAQL